MATVRGNPVAWENFYKTARWRRLRKLQLIQASRCKFCLERGIVTPKVAGSSLVAPSFQSTTYCAPAIRLQFFGRPPRRDLDRGSTVALSSRSEAKTGADAAIGSL